MDQTKLVRIDPLTGEQMPLTYADAYGWLVPQRYVDGVVGKDAADYLFLGRQYIALGLEQGGLGRMDLYIGLLHDGLMKAMVALEIALRDALKRGKAVSLEKMLNQALDLKIIDDGQHMVQLREFLRTMRNDAFHGNPNQMKVTAFVPGLFKWILEDVNRLYAYEQTLKRRASSPVPDPQSDTSSQ